MTLTVYDGLMLLIVVACVFQGAWRGMVWQIAPIASLLLGYVVAYPLSERLAPYFGQPPANRLFAMVAIYLAVSLAVYLMGRSIRESLERLKLVEFDRHLGALLGGVKGVLFTIVLTIGLLSLSPQARPIILSSETRTVAARIMTALSPILPPAFSDVIRPYVDKLHDVDQRRDGVPPAFDIEPFVGQPLNPPPRASTARRDNVLRPPRRDDNDGFVPPVRDADVPFDLPDQPPTRRPAQRTPPKDGAGSPSTVPRETGEDDPFFSADPDRALETLPSRPR
jgi:membrane protein required for colicin V production